MDSRPMRIEKKKREKLGYRSRDTACAHCRRRKIRCLAGPTEGGCQNCKRCNIPCRFFPVEQEGGSKPRSNSGKRYAVKSVTSLLSGVATHHANPGNDVPFEAMLPVSRPTSRTLSTGPDYGIIRNDQPHWVTGGAMPVTPHQVEAADAVQDAFERWHLENYGFYPAPQAKDLYRLGLPMESALPPHSSHFGSARRDSCAAPYIDEDLIVSEPSAFFVQQQVSPQHWQIEQSPMQYQDLTFGSPAPSIQSSSGPLTPGPRQHFSEQWSFSMMPLEHSKQHPVTAMSMPPAMPLITDSGFIHPGEEFRYGVPTQHPYIEMPNPVR